MYNKIFRYMHLFFREIRQRYLITRIFVSFLFLAQVSFPYRLSSDVCLSVRMSVRLYVNLSYFRLLLKNHWANLNQLWHNASLGKGDSDLFK